MDLEVLTLNIEVFSDNFPAAFSAEDVAYVGDIVMEYMKQYGRRKL